MVVKMAKIKFIEDNIIIERGNDDENELLFNILGNQVENKSELENFLFQWKNRKVILGDVNLCG